MTAETPNLPAIRQQGTELGVSRPGGALVSKIAGEATKYLPSLTKKMHRVGDYEVDEQSYRQILIWLDQLAVCWNNFYERTKGEDGLVCEVHKSPERFCGRDCVSCRQERLDRFLYLQSGGIASRVDEEVINLDDLLDEKGHIISVNFGGLDLTEIDLSLCKEVRKICLGYGFVRKLDLSNCNKLEMLICDNNEIECLDLSRLPMLMELHCRLNNLSELDITACETSEFTLSCDPHVKVTKRRDQLLRIIDRSAVYCNDEAEQSRIDRH